MNKFVSASLGFLALASGTALAADLPAPVYKASPPPAPSWTGCYVNAGGGSGLWDSKQYLETYPGNVRFTADSNASGQGWFGTAGGGCDYQFHAFSWDVVAGAFGDYALMDLEGVAASGAFAGQETERSAWSGGLRVGVLVTPTLLTYTNGGYTGARFGQVNRFNQFTGVATGFDFAAHDYNGWFVGGGTEYAMTWDWFPIHGLFWRNEYRYASYQSANLPLVSSTGAVAPFIAEHSEKSVQTIATELVWRFNWPAPVAAKY